jgi:hypothetical protein
MRRMLLAVAFIVFGASFARAGLINPANPATSSLADLLAGLTNSSYVVDNSGLGNGGLGGLLSALEAYLTNHGPFTIPGTNWTPGLLLNPPQTTVVPEPSLLVLLGAAGVLGIGLARRKQRT